MPLIKSGSKAAVSTNISEMVKAGHPRDQAIAAALSTARRYGKAAGGPVQRGKEEIGPITDSEMENQKSEFQRRLDRLLNKRQSWREDIPASESLNPKDTMTPERMQVQKLPYDPRTIFSDSGRITGYDVGPDSRLHVSGGLAGDIDPFERAARRMRNSVRPEEGRSEGRFSEGLSNFIPNTLGFGDRYADGGEVPPNPEDIQEPDKSAGIRIRPPGPRPEAWQPGAVAPPPEPVPQIDPYEGIYQKLMRRSPIEGQQPPSQSLESHTPTPSEWIKSKIVGDAPIGTLQNDFGEKVGDASTLLPTQQAYDFTKAIHHNDPTAAAMAIAPGGKMLKSAAKEVLPEILKGASMFPMGEGQVKAHIAKSIQAPFPKDVAQAAIDQGYGAEQVENIASYLSPGGQKAFWKWHQKLSEEAPGKELFDQVLDHTAKVGAEDFILQGAKGETAAKAIQLSFESKGPKYIAEAIYKKDIKGQELNNVFSYIPKEKHKDVWDHLVDLEEGAAKKAVPQFSLEEEMAAIQAEMAKTPPAQPLAVGSPFQQLAALQAKQKPAAFGIPPENFSIHAEGRDPHAPWSDYDELHDIMSQTPINLSPNEEKAVAHWGDPAGYKAINSQLRGHTNSPTAVNSIDHLDKAIADNPLQSDTTAWRGIYGPQAEEFAKLKPGDTFFNAGYTATSLDPRRATHYGMKKDKAGAALVYHLPEGYPALYTSHPQSGNYGQGERELLLPHGANFRLIKTETIKTPTWHYSGSVSDETPKNMTVHHVEYVPEFQAGSIHQLDAFQKPGSSGGGSGKPAPAAPIAIKKHDPYEQTPWTAEDDAKADAAWKAQHPDWEQKYPDDPHAPQAGDDWMNVGEWEPNAGDAASMGFLDTGAMESIDPINKLAAKIRSHIRPIENWTAYRPHQITSKEYKTFKSVDPDTLPRRRSIQEEIKFGENDPKELEKRGWLTHAQFWKAGRSSSPPHPLDTPHPDFPNYPSEIFDPKTKKKGHSEPAFFLADTKGEAEGYTDLGPVGKPYIMNAKKPMEIDIYNAAGEHSYSKIGDEMALAIREARKMGADVLAIHRIRDNARGGKSTHTQYAVLDTSILRAPNAKFDPAKAHLRDPLSGIVGTLGTGAAAYGLSGQQTPEGMKRGGAVLDRALKEAKKYAAGGVLDESRLGRLETHVPHPSGMLDSSIPGRTDKLPISVKSGSYVIPADTVSGLGEGNTMGGNKVIQHMLHQARVKSMGMPKMPKLPGSIKMPSAKLRMRGAKTLPLASMADGGVPRHIPIIAAGGEFVVPPEDVANIGGGDLDKGHNALDKFVLKTRRELRQKLGRLKPPKVD